MIHSVSERADDDEGAPMKETNISGRVPDETTSRPKCDNRRDSE